MDESNLRYNLAKLLTGKNYMFDDPSAPQRAPGMSQPRIRREILSESSKFVIDRFWKAAAPEVFNIKYDLLFVEYDYVAKQDSGRFEINVKYSSGSEKILQSILKKDLRSGLWMIRDFYYNATIKIFFDTFEKLQADESDVNLRKHLEIIQSQVEEIEIYHQHNRSIIAFMTQGFKITAGLTFDILRAVPLRFFEHHGRAPSRDEWFQIVLNSKKFITMISSMHHDMLTDLKQYLNSADTFLERAPEGMRPSDFVMPVDSFEYDFEKNAMTLKKGTMLAWRKKIEQRGLPESERLGCPARKINYNDPHNGSEHDLIESLVEKGAEFMLHYAEPHLERYILQFGRQDKKSI